MTTLYPILSVLFIVAIWAARNDAAMRRRRSESLKAATEERGCYHGITRHDPNWEV